MSQENGAAVISTVKMGRHKKMIADIHKWQECQVSAAAGKSLLQAFIKRIFGLTA